MIPGTPSRVVVVAAAGASLGGRLATELDDELTVETVADGAAEFGDPGLAAGVVDAADGPGDAGTIRDLSEQGPVIAVVEDDERTARALEAGAADVVRRGAAAFERLLVRRVRAAADRSRTDAERAGYRTLVEQVGDPMYVLDAAGRIRSVNDAFLEHSGFDRDEVLGEHVSTWMDDGDVERGRELLTDLAASDGSDRGRFEFSAETADGDVRRYEDHVAALTDEDGRLCGSIGVIRDVTDREERERELRRYRRVVETAGDAMYALDDEGYITMVNESHVEFAGAQSREAMLGAHALEYMSEEAVRKGTERIAEILDDPERERARFEFEYDRDGERRVFEDIVAVITDDDGVLEGSVGVIRDVTERKRRKEALEAQNERLDEFASVVSHDIRNPLNVVEGRIDLARETGDVEHLDDAEAEIERIDELLEELLALAREGKVVNETGPVELPELAERAWEGVDTAAATVEVTTDRTVEADGTRLQELLENLYRNAVEHGGDEVTVRVGDLDGGFYVADDGPGIPPAERDEVFDRGYTTAEDGTGFGLAIVDRIADAHGWDVDVTDGEAGGARFEFVL